MMGIFTTPLVWIMIGISHMTYCLKSSIGNYIYKFRPRLFNALLMSFSLTFVYVIWGVSELIRMGKSIWIIAGFISLLASIIILAVIFTKPEGITEKGMLFSTGFIQWDNILDFD